MVWQFRRVHTLVGTSNAAISAISAIDASNAIGTIDIGKPIGAVNSIDAVSTIPPVIAFTPIVAVSSIDAVIRFHVRSAQRGLIWSVGRIDSIARGKKRHR